MKDGFISFSGYYNKLAISKKNDTKDSKELSLGLALKNVF